jgi:methionyl-tRNA synthetase
MEPFIPFTAQKLYGLLNFEKTNYQLDAFVQLQSGHEISQPSLLFQNIEDDIIQLQLDNLKQKSETKATAILTAAPVAEVTLEPLKPQITFDDFSKMDLRVGTVLEAEKVEKADKLLKLKVDLGFEQRTIVSGIALDFTPESMIGKQITILANLAPRKIKGIESNGMILMGKNLDGSLKLIAPNELADNGTTVA